MAKPKNAAKELFTDDLERIKGAKNLAAVYELLEARSKKISVNSGDFVDTLQDAFEEAENIADSQKDLFSTTINLKSLQKKANAEQNKDQKKIYQTLVNQGRVQANLRKGADASLKKNQKIMAPIKKYTSMIPGIGSTLTAAFDASDEAFKKGLSDPLDETQKKTSRLGAGFKVVGLAIATYVGKNLFESMQSMGAGLMDVLSRPEFIFFGSESRAIADEFGNMNESSMGLGLNMKLMSVFSGVSAQNQAKIMGMMAATSDSSNEVLHAQMKSYKQAGVPFRAIMDDVAGNTEHFAKFAKDGGANIFEAAAKAKELGVNLGDVASISNSLLQFESSIEAQMNAQVLLGKNLNLDKARQLAFTGDQAGMMEEIVNQVGGEAEFNKMNVIQRQALADSVGLTVEKMGALVRAEEQNAAAADKSKQKYKVMGAVILGIIGAVLGGLAFFTGGTSLLGIAAMAGGGIAGSAIGYGIGGAVGLAEGGIVSGPTSAVVGEAGPEAVVPLPAQGVKMDLKPMVNKMDELIAINRRMIDEIVNLQVG
jgi:hypothetical protein